MLKGEAKFEWTLECAKAFHEIKEYISTTPTLSVPEACETVYVYLAILEVAISSVLV